VSQWIERKEYCVKRSQDFRQVRKVIDVVLKLGPTCALRLLNFFDNEDVWTHNKELWVRREEPRLCNFTHNHKTWIHHIAHILNWKEARMTIRLKRDSNMLCVPDVIRIRNIWLQIEGKTWLRNTSYSDSSQLAQSWEDYTSKEKKKREKKIKCAGLFWLSTCGKEHATSESHVRSEYQLHHNLKQESLKKLLLGS